MKWLIGAAVAFVAYMVWKSQQKPFAGMVMTGWGGNWTGNMPAYAQPGGIIGQIKGATVAGPPGNPFAFSTTTNGGSGGG